MIQKRVQHIVGHQPQEVGQVVLHSYGVVEGEILPRVPGGGWDQAAQLITGGVLMRSGDESDNLHHVPNLSKEGCKPPSLPLKYSPGPDAPLP